MLSLDKPMLTMTMFIWVCCLVIIQLCCIMSYSVSWISQKLWISCFHFDVAIPCPLTIQSSSYQSSVVSILYILGDVHGLHNFWELGKIDTIIIEGSLKLVLAKVYNIRRVSNHSTVDWCTSTYLLESSLLYTQNYNDIHD